MKTGSIVAIVAGAIVYWLLEGLMYGALLSGQMQDVMAVFGDIANNPEDGNMFVWFVPSLVATGVLMFLGGKGGTSIGSMATAGAVLFGAVCFIMEFQMFIGIKGYPFMSWSIMAVGWEIVAGGIVGAVMGFIATKMNK